MFNSPIPLIFRISNEIKDFKEIQNGGSKIAHSRWRIQDCGYFDVKDVIVASLSLLMTTNLSPFTRILLDMLLQLRLCGYTSHREEKLIK